MIRADVYFAFDYLHQKKIVDRLRFSALVIVFFLYMRALIFKDLIVRLTFNLLFFNVPKILSPICKKG
jgi:hypothetical protein